MSSVHTIGPKFGNFVRLESPNISTKAGELKSDTVQAKPNSYDVDEHISSQRPNRERRFPKKYKDFIVKKVRVISSSAKKSNYRSDSERTNKSDLTALQNEERRKERDIDEVQRHPNKEVRSIKRTVENTNFRSGFPNVRKDDQSQRSIEQSPDQSAASFGVGSLFIPRPVAIIDRTACPGSILSRSSSTIRRRLFRASMPKIKFTKTDEDRKGKCQRQRKCSSNSYDVGEHISSQRPNGERRFPKKYKDFVVKKSHGNFVFSEKVELPKRQ